MMVLEWQRREAVLFKALGWKLADVHVHLCTYVCVSACVHILVVRVRSG